MANQVALLYDLISAGPIEGLVDGARSVFLNNTPFSDSSVNGSVTADRIRLTNLESRFTTINDADRVLTPSEGDVDDIYEDSSTIIQMLSEIEEPLNTGFINLGGSEPLTGGNGPIFKGNYIVNKVSNDLLGAFNTEYSPNSSLISLEDRIPLAICLDMYQYVTRGTYAFQTKNSAIKQTIVIFSENSCSRHIITGFSNLEGTSFLTTDGLSEGTASNEWAGLAPVPYARIYPALPPEVAAGQDLYIVKDVCAIVTGVSTLGSITYTTIRYPQQVTIEFTRLVSRAASVFNGKSFGLNSSGILYSVGATLDNVADAANFSGGFFQNTGERDQAVTLGRFINTDSATLNIAHTNPSLKLHEDYGGESGDADLIVTARGAGNDDNSFNLTEESIKLIDSLSFDIVMPQGLKIDYRGDKKSRNYPGYLQIELDIELKATETSDFGDPINLIGRAAAGKDTIDKLATDNGLTKANWWTGSISVGGITKGLLDETDFASLYNVGSGSVYNRMVQQEFKEKEGFIKLRSSNQLTRTFTIDLSSYDFVDFRLRFRRLTPDTFTERTSAPVGWKARPRTGEKRKIASGTLAAQLGIISLRYSEQLNYPLSAYMATRISTDSAIGNNIPKRKYLMRGLKVKVPTNYITREENLARGGNAIASYNRDSSTGLISPQATTLNASWTYVSRQESGVPHSYSLPAAARREGSSYVYRLGFYQSTNNITFNGLQPYVFRIEFLKVISEANYDNGNVDYSFSNPATYRLDIVIADELGITTDTIKSITLKTTSDDALGLAQKITLTDYSVFPNVSGAPDNYSRLDIPLGDYKLYPIYNISTQYQIGDIVRTQPDNVYRAVAPSQGEAVTDPAYFTELDITFNYTAQQIFELGENGRVDIELEIDESRQDLISLITTPSVLWDGTFRGDKKLYPPGDLNSKLVYTNNPAWIYLDILTNRDYGLGDFVSIDDIDIFELYKVAQYCDELVPDGLGGLEPRFTCNTYIRKNQEAHRLLKDIASCFRGFSVWQNGSITAVQDRPKHPVYLFTQANVIDGTFNYSSTGQKDRINSVQVTWNNPSRFYEQDVVIVDNVEDIIAQNRVVSRNIVGFGCTSEAQAKRIANWTLNTDLLETESVSFSTGIIASSLKVGDVISIQDQESGLVVQYAGRFVGKEDLTITTPFILDREITLKREKNYVLNIAVPIAAYILAQDSAVINGISYTRGQKVRTYSNGDPLYLTPRSDYTDTDLGTISNTFTDDSGKVVALQTALDTSISKYEIRNKFSEDSLTTNEVFIVKSIDTDEGNLVREDPANLFYADLVWAITPTDSLDKDTPTKEFRILAIEEEEPTQIYKITASDYSQAKFDLSERGITTYQQPSPLDLVVPTPQDLQVSYGTTASGENEAILKWELPSFNENADIVSGFKILVEPSTGSNQAYSIDITGRNSTSYLFSGFDTSLVIRIQAKGRTLQEGEEPKLSIPSQPITVLPNISGGQNLDIFATPGSGGVLDSPVDFNSSTGMLSLLNSSFTYVSGTGAELTVTNAAQTDATRQVDFSSMPLNSTAVWLHDTLQGDESTAPWVPAIRVTDTTTPEPTTYFKALSDTSNGLEFIQDDTIEIPVRAIEDITAPIVDGKAQWSQKYALRIGTGRDIYFDHIASSVAIVKFKDFTGDFAVLNGQIAGINPAGNSAPWIPFLNSQGKDTVGYEVLPLFTLTLDRARATGDVLIGYWGNTNANLDLNNIDVSTYSGGGKITLYGPASLQYYEKKTNEGNLLRLAYMNNLHKSQADEYLPGGVQNLARLTPYYNYAEQDQDSPNSGWVSVQGQGVTIYENPDIALTADSQYYNLQRYAPDSSARIGKVQVAPEFPKRNLILGDALDRIPDRDFDSVNNNVTTLYRQFYVSMPKLRVTSEDSVLAEVTRDTNGVFSIEYSASIKSLDTSTGSEVTTVVDASAQDILVY